MNNKHALNSKKIFKTYPGLLIRSFKPNHVLQGQFLLRL